jgi:hypothetical protein
MCIRIDKRTVVVLPMNFDEKLTDLTHKLNAERLVIDEGLGAAVCGLDTAKDQVAVVVDTIVAQQLAGRVLRTDIEDRGHLATILSMTHETAIAAPT